MISTIDSMEQMADIFQELMNERRRQDDKWGEQNHPPAYWLSVLGEEFGEVCRAVCEGNFSDNADGYRNELLQTAAVCVSMIQSYDRSRKGRGRG